MKIAIDIDDVVADSVQAIMRSLSLKSGLKVTEEHFKYPGDYWGYYEELIERLGLDEEYNYEAVVGSIEEGVDLVYPIVGAREALGRISKKMEIVFITARNNSREKETKRWVEEHFGLTEEYVHVLGNDRTKPLRSKGEVCVEIGADWLIDDNPEHCLSAIEHGLNTILFGDYGWQYKAPEHLYRCKNWEEVERLLDEKFARK